MADVTPDDGIVKELAEKAAVKNQVAIETKQAGEQQQKIDKLASDETYKLPINQASTRKTIQVVAGVIVIIAIAITIVLMMI